MKRTDNPVLARRLFDQCLFASLAMAEPEGDPYCVPIHPAREGDFLYFHCALKGRKIDALRAHPRVCLSCVGKAQVIPGVFETDFESVIAFGTAEEVTDREEKIAALTLITKKYCPDDLWDLPRVLDKSLPATAIWRIRLEEITTKG